MRTQLKYELPDIYEVHKLSNLVKVAEFLDFTDKYAENYDHLHFELAFNSQRLGIGTLTANSRLADVERKIVQVLNNAWTIAKYFDIHERLDIKIVDLLRQLDPLNFFASLVRPERSSYMIVFWLNGSLPEEPLPFCAPITGSVRLGAYKLIIAVAIIGVVKPTGRLNDEGAEYRLTTSEIKICRRYMYEKDEVIPHTKEELKEAVVKEFEETHHILQLDNF